MVLYGKTDKATIKNAPPKVDVRAFVGTKKKVGRTKDGKEYLGYGDDLITHFRLEAQNKAIANSLKRLGVDDKNLIEELEIIAAYSSVEKTFDTKAQRWSRKGDELSGLLWECDRRNIYNKKESYQTSNGDIRYKYVECHEPCPVAETQEKCPNGCADTGTLYFYIPALLDLGHNALCSLVLSGEFNIRELTAALYNIESQFGTIKEVMGSPSTYNAVLYRLGRYTANRPHPVIYQGKRTGKTKQEPTHLVSLQVDPHWLAFYQNMQQFEQVKALGYKPDLKMIQQVYGEVEVLKESTPQLSGNAAPAALPSWSMTKERALELKNLRIKEGWSDYAYEELLFDMFDIRDRSEIVNLTEAQFVELKDAIASVATKSAFKVIS